MKIRGLIRWVALILCTTVLGLGMYSASASLLAGDPMPMPFGYGAAVVLSGSMEPEIAAGDLIIVKRTDSFREDQIVVFEDRGSLIVHRIIALDGTTVITQGDANNTADAPIHISMIRGEMVYCISGAGEWVNRIKSPVGITVILLLAFLLLEMPYSQQKQIDKAEQDAIKEEIRKLKKEL